MHAPIEYDAEDGRRGRAKAPSLARKALESTEPVDRAVPKRRDIDAEAKNSLEDQGRAARAEASGGGKSNP